MVNNLDLCFHVSTILLVGGLCDSDLAVLIDLVSWRESKAPASTAVVVKHAASWLNFSLGEAVA